MTATYLPQYTKKLSKYKDLEIEIQKMWGTNVTMIPVVIGALGVINEGTEKFTNRIPGQPRLREIQKIVLTSTAHILRRTVFVINNRMSG